MTQEIFSPGLEGVIAGETAICSVEQDGLNYRGYAVADLAAHASFEEVAYLLLSGELPTPQELVLFKSHVDARRELPGPVVDLLRLIPRATPMMDVLRTAVSMCGHFDACQSAHRDPLLCGAERMLAVVPGIIAARLRILAGKPLVAPKLGLSHAEQFIWQAFERHASALEAKLLNLTFILYAEHEYNASTFAARVCTSTLSDLESAIVAAIGTLKGPLHGGANEAAIHLINRFRSAAEARQGIKDALARKEKIMGFGHRVYRNGDHRAFILEQYIPPLAEARGLTWKAEVFQAIKETVWNEKKIHPNVDFPCGLAYYLLDFPIDCYTPLFVAARVSGWCAHVIEQHRNNRLIRPRSRYVGPPARKYVPLAQRG